MTALVLLTSCFVSGCNDDDDNDSQAKAVLASAKSLTFDGLQAEPQMITVYSDAQWTAEVPEWIVIYPATGAGTTEVTISVADNLRDGTLDNPRKAELVFKGATIASRSSVIISQKGDNYRDGTPYAVDKVYDVPEETYMILPDALVVAKTSDGYMLSDATCSEYVYARYAGAVEVGDKVSVKAQKASDSQKMAYIEVESMTVTSSGNTISRAEAADITGAIDTYTSDRRDYVAVEGVLSGKTITVSDAKFSVSLVDVPAYIDLNAIEGHFIRAIGYFAGVATPYVRVFLESVEDKGEARITYWSEDFEWLAPFAAASGAGRTVESDDLNAEAPQIVKAEANGTTALAYAESLGYKFHRVTTKTAGECIYIQENYLKMGKTSYQAGFTLPSIDNVPADAANLMMEFDWCPMRQGSGKIDPVNLIVIVENGGNETTFEVPTHNWANGHTLEWIKASIELSGITINKNTNITIRQTEWPLATANRWFIDNIRIYTKL